MGDNRRIDTPTKTMGEQFIELLPFYLSIGMTYAEYWEGDNKLPRYFREAYKEKSELRDAEMWRQGLYIYEAVSVAINNALAQKKSQLKNYSSEPYMVQEKKEYQRQKEEQQKQLEMEKFKKWLAQLKQRW